MVGHGVRLPCSDSDESEDDVLSIGPMRPMVTAAPLGGAGGHEDEWSVNSWTAGDRNGTSCAQLDNFDWVMLAGYPVGKMHGPEEDVSLSDTVPDVCDVPNEFPVDMETVAIQSLFFAVVVQTRPQGAVTQSCPCPFMGGRISWRWTIKML